MSWRDGFTAKGSFRKAEFYIRSSDVEVGRRVQEHYFPERAKPLIEDLGGAGNRFRVEAYCVGENYRVQRDELLAVARKPGAGELLHPYYGRMTVTLAKPFTVKESTREGGYAVVSFEFVESGDVVFFTAEAGVDDALDKSVNEVVAEVESVFSKGFELPGLFNDVSDFLSEVDGVISSVVGVVGDVSGAVSSLVRAPIQLASALVGGVNNISAMIKDPFQSLAMYRQLFGSGRDRSPGMTPRNKQQAANTQLLNELVRTVAVAESCRLLNKIETVAGQGALLTRSKIFELRDELLDQIELRQDVDQIVYGGPLSDDLYVKLQGLKKSIIDVVSSKSARLPDVGGFTPMRTLPALVVAHRVHGDALRESEIVSINGIKHPLFVRGGDALEIVND